LAIGGLLLAVASRQACAQSGVLLYTPNFASGNVSLYTSNPNGTLTSTATLTGAGATPNTVAVRGDQAFAYVTDSSSNQLSVINTATQGVVQTIATGPNPFGIAINPTGTTVYVANNVGGDSVSVYSANASTGQLTQTTTIALAAFAGPRGIAFSPDGSRAYITEQNANTVVVVNTATNAVVGAVTVGGLPVTVAVSPDGTHAYVTNNSSNSVSVINTATNTVVATVATGAGPNGVVVSPDGKYFYIGNQTDGTITQFNVTTNTALGSIASGTQTSGLAISPDGTALYASNFGSNNVAMFSISTGTGFLTSLGTIAAGSSPLAPGMCGNGSAMLGSGGIFIANTAGAVNCAGATATFSGGTLLINGANEAITTPMVLAAQGGIINTNGNSATLAGAISGSGGLTKTGLGTLTLAANNTYSGATSVSMGTLQAGIANAFSPFSAFSVASGATLSLNGFNQIVGSVAGAGNVTLGSAILTTGNDNTSTIFSGVMSGTGGLAKIGTGTLTLTGANTFTGGTALNAGGFVVNGSLASGVTVNGGALAVNGTLTGGLTMNAGTAAVNGSVTASTIVNGGTLSGGGTIGGLTLNGGIVAPGNSIGTLTVNGNLVQNGGAYQVEVNAAGQGDRINATGTAAIKGGTVQVLAQSGTYARNTTYTILSATGGVSGAYSSVSSNFAFLTPSLSYDPNNVYLLLFQNSSAFTAGAQTPNQYAVGVALDQANATATGDLNTVLNAMSVLSNTQGPAALNAISGQPYADFGTLNVQGAALFMNAVGQQMALARGSAAAAGQRQALAQACEIESCDAVSPWGGWASALGGLGSVAGNGNSSTLTYNFGGGAAGIDYRLDPRFLVGLGAGYTAANQWVDSFMGRGWSDSVAVTAYGSFTQAGFYTDALAGYAYSGNQMQRQILIPGLQPRTANGSTGANQFLGQVESGYKLGIYAPALATLTPFGRFQVTTVNQNGFSEWGSANSLNLNVAQQTTTSLRSTFGAELAGAIGLGDTKTLDLALRLGWMHEYADTGRPITAAFAGAPSNAFTVYGATPRRDSAIIGFLASTSIAAATSLYLRYDGSIGNGTDNHTLNVGVRVVW
jgi:YVTN family beta-propeller protein/autotransporter-associated beta strand protein